MPSFKGRLWKVPLGTPHSVAVKTRLLRLKTFHCLASSVTGLTESMFVFIGIETPSWYYYRPAGGIGDTVKDLTNVLYMEDKRPETDMRIFSANPKRESWKPSCDIHQHCMDDNFFTKAKWRYARQNVEGQTLVPRANMWPSCCQKLNVPIM